MSESYDTRDGTTFLFNPGLQGNVTILRGNTEVTVSGDCLLELVEQIVNRPRREPATRTTH